MEYSRALALDKVLDRKSSFLFGARGTGKTTLIHTQLTDARVYDLLDSEVFERLVRRPKLLEEDLKAPTDTVVIDEIQKLPSLLDEVQRLMGRHPVRFLLTGSSARKLKRGLANLLGGRAWETLLFPLTVREIGDFDLVQYLNRGGLPAIYLSPDYREELHAYVSLYLKEEIQAEALTRKLGHFARFLDTMALCNGEELNFEGIASDAGVPAQTVRNYLAILEDTLVGFQVPAFLATKKRKAISRSKFYFFDIGVTNTLAKRGEIQAGSELFGKAFEHFLMLEVRAYLHYTRKRVEQTYWRSTSGFEVDCLIGRHLAAEFKATKLVTERDLRGLRALREEGLIQKLVVVSNDPEPRRIDGISVLPWAMFLDRLWRDQLVDTKA